MSLTTISWIIRIIIAIIFLQTLYFKFTGAKESKYIFTKLNLEPHGRIGSGIGELIASILLLIPSLQIYGAILSLFIITPAIFFHLTKLGVQVQGDKGLLFTLALVVFSLSIVTLVIH